MAKTLIQECSTCNSWVPDTCRQLEEKGHCYKIIGKPEPKKRTDNCGDWQEYDGGVLEYGDGVDEN